jgi:hypothetical protein
MRDVNTIPFAPSLGQLRGDHTKTGSSQRAFQKNSWILQRNAFGKFRKPMRILHRNVSCDRGCVEGRKSPLDNTPLAPCSYLKK